MRPAVSRAPSTFSLVRGGPFHHLLGRLGLVSPRGLKAGLCLALLTWLPLALAEGVRVAMGRPLSPIFRDLSVHIRLLFTLPTLLVAEHVLDDLSASAIRSLDVGRLCEPSALARLTRRAEQLRDTPLVEAALFALALVGDQLVFWDVVGAQGPLRRALPDDVAAISSLWYAAVALPLLQFVLFRWLWRWLIWTHLLVRLSRQRLSILATHADLAGGLAPLARPVSGFSGFVLAIAAILAGTWGTKVLQGKTTIEALLPGAIMFLLVALLAAVGPLLLFMGQLYRARWRALAAYGDFVREYTLGFHARWIEPRTAAEPPLGSSDIQSLADVGGAFEVITRTRVVPFGPRTLLTVVVAALLPLAPLFASSLTVADLRRIVGTVLGGIPF